MDSYGGSPARGRWKHAALIDVTSGHMGYSIYFPLFMFEFMLQFLKTFWRPCLSQDFKLSIFEIVSLNE